MISSKIRDGNPVHPSGLSRNIKGGGGGGGGCFAFKPHPHPQAQVICWHFRMAMRVRQMKMTPSDNSGVESQTT